MTFVVRIVVGRGKNRSVTQSIPLPNKKRVVGFIKRNPFVRSNTNIQVTNLRTKKIMMGKESRFLNLKRF